MARKTEKGSKALVAAEARVETNIKATGKATDLAGLGAAAKTKAAHEIARAVAVPLGNAVNTAATAMFGARAARNLAQAQVFDAEAKARSSIIQAETELELERLRVTAERVRNEESRKTAYIEGARDEAMRIADLRGDEEAKPLPEELTLAWVDGVKECHSSVVRDLYSKILANQTDPKADVLSGPSLALLKNLDGNLARNFEKIIAQFCIVGCYPFDADLPVHNKILLGWEEVQILNEIGFTNFNTSDRYSFKEMQIRRNVAQFVGSHRYIVLSHRANSLAKAIYGNNPLENFLNGFQLDRDELSYYYSMIAISLMEKTNEGVVITLRDAETGSSLDIHSQLKDEHYQQGALVSGGVRYAYVRRKDSIEDLKRVAAASQVELTEVALNALTAIHEQSENFSVIET